MSFKRKNRSTWSGQRVPLLHRSSGNTGKPRGPDYSEPDTELLEGVHTMGVNDDPMNLIGNVIGSYRIIKVIANGGFGVIYLAEHIVLKTCLAAIKVLNQNHHRSPREHDRFLQEAHQLHRLKGHPYILSLIDVGIYNGVPFIIAQYLPKGSLQDRLESQPHYRLSWEETALIFWQVGSALDYAHRLNIIHCDIKPGNILFNARGEAVLADFGIAHTSNDIRSSHHTVIGSVDFMPVEQFRGDYRKESDQYALACLLYRLLTGHMPFGSSDLFQRLQQPDLKPVAPARYDISIPAYVERAILKALANDPAQRHASIAAFMQAARLPAPEMHIPDLLLKSKEEWYQEGDAHYQAKHYDSALDAYNRAILIDPSFAMAHDSRGATLYRLGNYEAALEAHTLAIALDPRLALAHNGRGNAFYQLGRYKEALAAYEEAIRLAPSFAEAYHNIGLVLKHLGRLYPAQQAFARARRLGLQL